MSFTELIIVPQLAEVLASIPEPSSDPDTSSNADTPAPIEEEPVIQLPAEPVVSYEDFSCQAMETREMASTQTDAPEEPVPIDESLYLPDVQRTLGIVFGASLPAEVLATLDEALAAFGLEKQEEAVFDVPLNVCFCLCFCCFAIMLFRERKSSTHP